MLGDMPIYSMLMKPGVSAESIKDVLIQLLSGLRAYMDAAKAQRRIFFSPQVVYIDAERITTDFLRYFGDDAFGAMQDVMMGHFHHFIRAAHWILGYRIMYCPSIAYND